MQTLYFIESIHLERDRNNGNDTAEIVLEDVRASMELGEKRFDGYGGNDIEHVEELPFLRMEFSNMPTLRDSNRALREGWYVYYDLKEQVFSSAAYDELAIARRKENRDVRQRLLALHKPEEQEMLLSGRIRVKSYHVNVGHGNCTIILIQDDSSYVIWMVDCGAIDQINRNNYYSNIQTCFSDISKELGVQLDQLRISKFMLTHWHYDHISGMQSLINDHYIDPKTQFYMNLYYGHSSQCVNNLLKELYRLGVACYEPVATMTLVPSIAILHPECRIRKWYYARDSKYRVVTKLNNTSVVYSIAIGDKVMVCPGDLEKDGWDAMTKSRSCQKRPLCNTDYYCISHHGSVNGHVDINCLGMSHYSNVKQCVTRNLSKAILMGRDGAYNGIYDRGVVNYWQPILRYSEKDAAGHLCRAYVLDWNSGGEYYL